MTKTRLVDFNKIQERISFEQILEHYEIKLREEGKSWVGPCPLCTDEQSGETRRFRVTPEINAWKCFNCRQGGNKLALVAALEFTDKKGAAIILANAVAQQFEIDVSECYLNSGHSRQQRQSAKEASAADPPADIQSPPGEDSAGDGEGKEPEEPATVNSNNIRGNKPLGWETGLKGLDPEHDTVLEAGFTPEVIKSFGAGMCSKGMMKGRLAVPIYNDDMQLLGYCGIGLDGREDRLRWPKPEHFERGLELFNLYQATNSKQFAEHGLILVEDILQVISIAEEGWGNAIAIMGEQLTHNQLLHLQRVNNPSGLLWIGVRSNNEALQRQIYDLSLFTGVRSVIVQPIQPTKKSTPEPILQLLSE